MIKTYRIATKAFAGTFPVAITISVILALAKQFLPDTSLAGSLIAFALVAFYAHRAILLGETHSWRGSFRKPPQSTPAVKLWPFLWRMFIWWVFCRKEEKNKKKKRRKKKKERELKKNE